MFWSYFEIVFNLCFDFNNMTLSIVYHFLVADPKRSRYNNFITRIKHFYNTVNCCQTAAKCNAVNATLITAASNARPKIADYPFTTLHPNLGVVRLGPERSFVIADIPGLIEGASEGAGLGHQFLRHLQRTRLLLHIVDIAPFDDGVDPVQQAKAIVAELKKYDPKLHAKPRWLVLNKLDMVPEDERAPRVADFVRRMRWKGPVFEISALTREGVQPLLDAIWHHVAAIQRPPEVVDPRFEAAGDTP